MSGRFYRPATMGGRGSGARAEGSTPAPSTTFCEACEIESSGACHAHDEPVRVTTPGPLEGRTVESLRPGVPHFETWAEAAEAMSRPGGAGLPIYSGQAARRKLVRLYGLPNAYPDSGEGVFSATRELFVDDSDAGRPVAIFDPGKVK